MLLLSLLSPSCMVAPIREVANKYFCYDSVTLELIREKNLVLGLTQENLIENSVQDCLSYILNYHGPCYYFSNLL